METMKQNSPPRAFEYQNQNQKENFQDSHSKFYKRLYMTEMNSTLFGN